MLCTPLLTKSIVALGALFSLATMPLTAQTATSTTPPVGYVRTDLLGQSDTFTAASLTRPPVYTGTVESASGISISVTGSPNWSAAELTYVSGSQPNTYYVRIGAAPDGEENPFEGRDFKVEANGGSTLIVTDPLNENLVSLPAGTKIEVIPYWTLKTLFPAEDAGVSFEASPSALNRKTEIYLLPEQDASGVLFSRTYYFSNGSWKKIGVAEGHLPDDVIIPINSGFIIRNKAELPYSLSIKGSVSVSKSKVVVKSRSDAKQETVLSSGRPVAVALKDLDLEKGCFGASASPLLRSDELYLYSNETSGYSKAASGTYYFHNNIWKKVNAPATADFGDTKIAPDQFFIIRKAITAGNTATFWENIPNY